jgi:hypothetical protein
VLGPPDGDRVASPPKADITKRHLDVRFGSIADIAAVIKK